MSKVVITKNMSAQERLAVIKEASRKFQAKQTRNARLRDYTETPKEEQGIDTHNINAYTDSEKYVDEYYGAKCREQASYESYEGWN